jgi:hypothetical protein
MKKVIILSLTIIIALLITACGSPTSTFSSVNITPSPSITNAPIPSSTPFLFPTSSVSESPAIVRISLELHRNGKTYEIIVGSADYNNGGNNATPRPYIIDTQGVNSASLKWYGDIDKDGETEYIVSLLTCAVAHCLAEEAPYVYETIQVYKYDLANDKYFVVDKFQAKLPAVKTYMDVDHDGNPELITRNYGFCYLCTPYRVEFSPITILQFEQGKFKDITHRFPDLIEKDAHELLEMAKTNKYEGSVPLASYFYDMYRLGKTTEAGQVVLQICEKTVKLIEGAPGFDCNKYLESIETEISRYESKP